MVIVDVEYCGKCNFEWQCKMLQNFLIEKQPGTEVICHKGRQGSFEVKINDQLVHSKLTTLAFPDHESVLENVQKAQEGLPLSKIKEQPIENCCIL
ncbi:migration and invasion enhancer 1-like [Teleopsis dalmanni]|uniref:migration and invasion enhancer 1-like n=1 Tax=Teleopsis dalmanni TaxID=139649 RepID=UPI0018CFE3A7|nr:migration and invasion enhancer 1-like [Teleopsis dalmanni]XP_037937587.1 migration and invasion enhancer 1-like [Teleopsis dalmanni]